MFFVLAILLTTARPVAHAASCEGLYARLRGQPFQEQEYRVHRDRYRVLLKTENTETLRKNARTFEEKIAFLEAVMEKNGIAPAEETIAKRFRNAVKKIDWEKGVTAEELDELVSTYYLARFGDPKSIRAWLGQGRQLDRLLAKKLETEFAGAELEKVLPIHAPASLRESWKRTFANHRMLLEKLSFGIQAIISGVGTSMTGVISLPVGIPTWKVFHQKVLTKELLEEARRSGLDAVRPKVYAAFKNKIQAEIYFSYFTKTWNALSWSIFAYSGYRQIREHQKKEQGKLKDMMNEMEQLGDKTALAETLLRDWAKKYREENGREPSREEWAEMRIFLRRLAP